MDTHNNAIREGIRSFIVQNFPGAKKRAFNDDLQLLQSGIIDSLGVLNVVGFLEETYKIRIDDDELSPDNFSSVRSLVSFVQRKNQTEAAAK
jgi:acyl carrier protein